MSDPRASTAGTQAWHRRLHRTCHDELSEDTAQTPGMRRYEAISGTRGGSRKIWMGESHIAPGMVSGDHHHGEAETGIYVVRGHPVFVFLEDDAERRVESGPGDYVYVPPYVPHREENPSPTDEAVVVLARSTQEGIVVNLSSLRAEVPELDALIGELDAGAQGSRPATESDGLRMGSMTEITLLGGERHRVEGDVKQVEQLILNAARGSLMELAWLIGAQTAEPLGVNPEHVMTVRAVTAAGPPPVLPGAGQPS